MTDSLKVFKNQVAATKPASLSTTTIDVISTASNETAVLKDLTLSITHSNPTYATVYKYPAIVKQDNFPLLNTSSAANLALTGSQIVGNSSTLTVELQPETQKLYYGVFKAILANNNSGNTNFWSYDLSLLGTSPAGLGATILTKAKSNITQILASCPTSRSGCAIMRSGVQCYAYTNGNTLTIMKEDGTTVTTYSWPSTTNAICADGTYIYGKYAGSSNYLYRYNYQTLAAATDLTLDAYVPGYGSSNKGFVDSYNGFMYIKINGSDGAIYKINLTTGTTTSISTGLTQGEFLGGVINVNTSGVPYIITFGDYNYELLNLNTLSYSSYGSIFPTDPTTTTGNNVISIANGIVLVSNGSYNTSAVIDFNGSSPTMTLTTGIFAAGGEGNLMIGLQFQSAPPAVSRDIVYNLLATGVNSTN